MSGSQKRDVREVAEAVASLQRATDLVDAAAATQFGVNRTDMALLSLLDAHGSLSPGQLAAGLGLTPASTTVAIQRLTDAGYVVRSPAPSDRRRAIVEMTDEASQLSRRLYEPIGVDGARLLQKYSAEQLDTIYDFLVRGRQLQEGHAERILSATRNPQPTREAGGRAPADGTEVPQD